MGRGPWDEGKRFSPDNSKRQENAFQHEPGVRWRASTRLQPDISDHGLGWVIISSREVIDGLNPSVSRTEPDALKKAGELEDRGERFIT